MPVLEQVLERYPDDVKIIFKNFPLRNHKFSVKTASAALAAESQGKFWQFHDLLFKNYNQINDEKIRTIAIGLGFDVKDFESKMVDPMIQSRIKRDMSEGTRLGIRGTPTVFINGKLLRNRTLQGFQMAVDKELKKLGRKAVKPSS